MEPWTATLEIEFPATTLEELTHALIVRDLVNGSSYDVETEDSGHEFSVDIAAGDELEQASYRLLIDAEIVGLEEAETVSAFLEQVLEEAIDEAGQLNEAKVGLGEVPAAELEFRSVAEDQERWDLVIPDWLAPDAAVVPFGFRSFRTSDGSAHPDDAELDAHGRVIVVPFGDRFHMVGIPAPSGSEVHAVDGDSAPEE
jgi:hypothetical protein